tara:strand:- start:1344 stop:4643 length:3300 start_codon:yes stop_codon:yes gene_type:complete
MTDKDEFDNILKLYLENITNTSNGSPELEVRFTSKGKRPISKIDQTNVIQRLLSYGFVIQQDNINILRMQNEFIDKEGKTKISNVRVEINSLHNIQNYCKNNSLESMNPSFLQKNSVIHNEKPIKPVFKDNFNLKLDYKKENSIYSNSKFATSIKDSWNESKKSFRFINRVTLVHEEFPFQVDISIIKESNKILDPKNPKRKIYEMFYTFQEAEILNQPEKFEIEIECINSKVGAGTDYDNVKKLNKSLKILIKYILSGIQNTNYPIPYSEMDSILIDYLSIIVPKKEEREKIKISNKLFIGPSSNTLQLINIQSLDIDTNVPNVRKKYTVTDKADGLRKLMFIHKSQKIYLIDTNMNVQFTGAMVQNKDFINTIIDGEHILHNKKGGFINLYAAFDIYYLFGENVKNVPFVPEISETEKKPVNYFRLEKLMNVIGNFDVTSVILKQETPIRIETKKFKQVTDTQTIFQCCDTILKKEELGNIEYNTDGLIFTPSDLFVGASKEGEEGPLFKSTWLQSFKWKPPEYNTIDFLVNTQKTETGLESIQNIFQSGIDLSSYDQLNQYKTIILNIGYKEKTDGYINPCNNIINDVLPSPDDNDEIYKPIPFYPTNPSDFNTNICHIMLDSNKNMVTEEGEVFEDNTIVEFKYDMTRPENWRWIPLRLRYDKTEEFKRGFPQFGNAYRTANSNWYSIHHPITDTMLTSGENIPDVIIDDDIYYNRDSSNKNSTQDLRNFHNLYVKKKLIKSVSKRGDKLIDYAVGKAGDFSKWIEAKLGFVFGMDISKDNIENKLDGACARYLNNKKKYANMPSALFVQGNAILSIKDEKAFYNEKGKQISKAIFGEGPKDRTILGEGVYKHYGIANEGFNISSVQFAVHYFFENKFTLHEFLRNVSECTAINGYLIGTCFDGKKIFEYLNNIEKGDTKTIFNKDDNNHKVWSITKQYDHDTFDSNSSSLGYQVDVYQESINKTIREYLVNFDYFIQLLENYGFVVLNSEEIKDLDLPNSYGNFRQLYTKMEEEIKRNKKLKNEYGNIKMKPYEKEISFFNNYFVFKKVRSVNAKYVYESFVGKIDEIKDEDIVSIPTIKVKTKKLKKKLTLNG